MSDQIYTLAAWRVKEGRQSDFVAAWQELGRFFGDLESPPGEGILLQSLDEPQQFYSFGPWQSLEDVQAMRGHPDTPEAIGKLMALCDEGRPGTFRVAATG